jgi:predicted GIY-YIG superfamily endonuclease
MAHNHLKNKGYTSRCLPWIFSFYKVLETKQEAMTFETYLKSFKSKKSTHGIDFEKLRVLRSYPDKSVSVLV